MPTRSPRPTSLRAECPRRSCCLPPVCQRAWHAHVPRSGESVPTSRAQKDLGSLYCLMSSQLSITVVGGTEVSSFHRCWPVFGSTLFEAGLVVDGVHQHERVSPADPLRAQILYEPNAPHFCFSHSWRTGSIMPAYSSWPCSSTMSCTRWVRLRTLGVGQEKIATRTMGTSWPLTSKRFL
jgi:hypothetical protein